MGRGVRVAAFGLRVGACLLAGLTGLVGLAGLPVVRVAAAPANYVVTSVADAAVNDANCMMASCTLRQAVNASNANDPGTGMQNTITFALPAGAQTTLQTSGELPLNRDVTITGTGVDLLTVRRSGATGVPRFRIFKVASGVTAAISGLTITGGFTADGGMGSVGGGGAGIFNLGILTLTDVAVRGNVTGNGGTYTSEAGFGGGIVNNGTLMLIRSTVSDNTTGAGGSNTSVSMGMGNTSNGGFGGGIYNNGTSMLMFSTVSGNTAGAGGNSTNGNGGRGGGGGGIYSGGTLTLINSTVSGNTTGNGGTRSGTMGNGGSGGNGGGILNDGTLSLANATVSNNRTGIVGNGSSGGSGGGLYTSLGDLTIGGTIISGNSANGVGPDLLFSNTMTTTNNGYNLIGAIIGDPFPMGSGDLSATNPQLAPLAFSGGATQTRLPLHDSPARNMGNPAGCGPADQRGVARPQEGRCDIGAAEFVLLPLTLGAARAGAAGTQTVSLLGTGFYEGTAVFVDNASAPVSAVSPDGTQLTVRVTGRPGGTSVTIVAVNIAPTQVYSNTLTFVIPDAAPTPTRPVATLTPPTTAPARMAPRAAASPAGATTPTPLPAPMRR